MNWDENDRGGHVLGAEVDASRFVFDLIETEHGSAATSSELLDSVREEFEETTKFWRLLPIIDLNSSIVPIRATINTIFGNLTSDARRVQLVAGGSTLEEFPDFNNKIRSYMRLKTDELEAPCEAYDRLQLDSHANILAFSQPR